MHRIGPNLALLLIVYFASEVDLCQAGRLPLSIDYEIGGVSYAERIPTPEAVIGHKVGTRHSSPDQIVSYFRELASLSDRILVRTHGSTYEGRPLVHAIVTSAENQARLEKIRSRNLLLSETPSELGLEQLGEMPAIVLMGYSVHGNEASGSEAAMLLLYHLAAGQGPSVDSVLNDTVVIIDPMLNPDGRNRFVSWVNANRGRIATADPQDREHREPWPGGRTNHYWFDLNRDWLPAQLRETEARLQLYHHWRPQLLTDFHEMGSDATYFFQPGVPSRVNPLTPEATSALTKEISSYHARALDELGSLYYSEETFDDFYYGKGSTYPDINGGVGILFEQASSRSLRRQTASGLLRYDFTIRNQVATSLSTLQAAVELREKLLQNQREFYLEADELARQNPVKAYIFSPTAEGRQGLALIEILRQHRIRVHNLKRDLEIDGIVFLPGEYVVVPTAQPQTRLLQTLMEDVTEFQDSTFYDVSTWTLPRALGVEVRRVRQEISSFLGDEIKNDLVPEGELAGGRSEYAYLMEWGDFQACKALYRVLASGLSARFLVEPIEITTDGAEGSREFGPGTIIIPVLQNGVPAEHVHEIVKSVVQEDKVRIFASSTGLTRMGPDLGSPSARILEKPKIALLSGPGTSSSRVGETWFLLNERLEIPVSLVDVEDLERIQLSHYNTLIMTSGSSSMLSGEQLGTWIQSGGLLLVTQDAVRWAIEQKLIDESLRESKIESPNVPYSEVSQTRNAQEISGAIFRVSLDQTHPIAFGTRAEQSVFRTHTIFVEPSKQAGANVAVYTDDPLISGYVSPENLERLKGGAAIIARKVGSGAVVLFLDNPNFRAFWHSTSTLFLNAVFFGRSL